MSNTTRIIPSKPNSHTEPKLVADHNLCPATRVTLRTHDGDVIEFEFFDQDGYKAMLEHTLLTIRATHVEKPKDQQYLKEWKQSHPALANSIEVFDDTQQHLLQGDDWQNAFDAMTETVMARAERYPAGYEIDTQAESG